MSSEPEWDQRKAQFDLGKLHQLIDIVAFLVDKTKSGLVMGAIRDFATLLDFIVVATDDRKYYVVSCYVVSKNDNCSVCRIRLIVAICKESVDYGLMKSVDQLLEDCGLSVAELAQRAGLEAARTEAIVQGRWTPKPTDRQRIAQALSTEVDQIIWGHTMDPRNVRYRQFGLKEKF